MSLRSIFTKAHHALALCLVLWLGAVAPASAQTVIERLVSPGPLSQAHQEQQTNCGACHVSFQKGAQNSLCLDCHEDIAADVKLSNGFHGKSPDIEGKPCKSCHTEHEGLDFDIANFDTGAFDHSLTDYVLKGGHLEVGCKDCHKANKKYSEAPSECVSCHKPDEPHKGRLGDDCQSCHNVSDWKQVEFDHSATNFSLLGKHASADCKTCHIDEVYKDLPSKCIDCHKDDDTHSGAFGADCESCHTPNSWAKIAFNHGQKTGFSLTGKHAAIECNTCHTSTLFEPKLKPACLSCHRKDDDHKGRNGPDCADCHITSNWRTSKFDHDTKTTFSLRGAHASVACEGCHLEAVTKKLPGVTCIDCHREDDPHEGGEGENCTACHNENSWVENTRFAHDLSRFPLLGKHSVVECGDCHQSKRFTDAATECVSCHEEDDKHMGALGENCGACHNPNDWALWIFDHNAQTDFELTGAHKELACASCHRTNARKDISQSRDCIACHRADDKHRGQYGGNCGRCHTTDNFKSIRFP